MNAVEVQLEAGGLLPAKTKVDPGATEKIVARTYRHPALGQRPVVRLASDRLGQAEDLAMEFLGFEAPAVSAPVGVQQRRSLGFAAWALINDPKNAHYALDLVKRMKGAARQAKSKPGHAWDTYTEMAKDLGRSARHFLPPFWEEAGRAFKDLGNQTYAGRALNKSMESERVHALESDRARRRDVVLEFVLSGCLAANALSDYGKDLQIHYAPAEAYAIFRDLCVRRTRGGMAPWAALPKDITRLAKAAGLNGDQELEQWLEELIDTPAMGRPPLQFWKSCSSHCKRIVARNTAFAVALLRHTRPEPRSYGDSKLIPWLELLEEWGVFAYLWEDEHRGAPALGEPIAHWFGRVVRAEVPAPRHTLDMLQQLAPRLKKEGTPLPLTMTQRYGYGSIDIDVLEACLGLGIKIDDPPSNVSVTYDGWLTANVDHSLRNQDIVEAPKDERFETAVMDGLERALTCRGGIPQRGYGQKAQEQKAFPLAAGNRPGTTELWRRQTAEVVKQFKNAGLVSFEKASSRLESTLWPNVFQLFPDLAKQLNEIEPRTMLWRTLKAGVFDEYGWPALEEVVERTGIKISTGWRETTIFVTFPSVVLTDSVHGHVIGGDGTVKQHELRLPKKAEVTGAIPVGDDLAISYRDEKYQGHFHWVSEPGQTYDYASYGSYLFSGFSGPGMATVLPDGSIFLGEKISRPGDKQMPVCQRYLHDKQRFWKHTAERDPQTWTWIGKMAEIDPQTGKQIREGVPPWFEETAGDTVNWSVAELMPAPKGAENSPLGCKDGMLGWKVFQRRDGSHHGQGIDGRRLEMKNHPATVPVALLLQPGTIEFLPVTTAGGRGGTYSLWDPSGSTIIAELADFETGYAKGQACVLPLIFWHLLKPRDEASSRKLRAIKQDECAKLFDLATRDREKHQSSLLPGNTEPPVNPLTNLMGELKKKLPSAPKRMLEGVARIIEQAEIAGAGFIALRDKANADSKNDSANTDAVILQKSDQAAAQWGLSSFNIYGQEEVSISANLAAAAAFLKGETPPGQLPRTQYLWFAMLEDLPIRCWQTFWRATAARMDQKVKADVPWLEFLKFWQEQGIGQLPGHIDLMDGHPKGAKLNTWGGYDVQIQGGRAFSLQNGDDRFIVIESDSHYSGTLPYHFLRYSTAKKPGNPPEYEVTNVRKIMTKADPNQIAAFIAAVESSTELPLPTNEELAETAKNLSVSPVEIGLIWLGGGTLNSNRRSPLPTDLRTALGWKTTEATAGWQALINLNGQVRDELYKAVVADGPAAPFGVDRGLLLRSIEKAWREKMPKRLQLEADLQSRLLERGNVSRWQRLDYETLLAIAIDPAKHPLLQPTETEYQIVIHGHGQNLQLLAKNQTEPVNREGILRSIAHLVALIHAETPGGHPARPEIPALIQQTTRLLDHTGTLLDLCNVHLYEYGPKKVPAPSEWLDSYVGKTKVAKDGQVRFDDGFLSAAGLDAQRVAAVAFRPVSLKNEGDLARLLGILGTEASGGNIPQTGALPVILVIKSPGFQKLVKAILAKNLSEGQWPQNPLHTAPAVVAGIRQKHDLGEEAAVLYAQLLALPEPTTGNVSTWNGWTSAQYQKAAAELVENKWVLETTRARAGRKIFLPGEWRELKAPWLPIETWKLAHLVELGLPWRDPCPLGGPLVLRPFEDLFAAAWKRVVDGDEPRYEEVKRKKKTK